MSRAGGYASRMYRIMLISALPLFAIRTEVHPLNTMRTHLLELDTISPDLNKVFGNVSECWRLLTGVEATGTSKLGRCAIFRLVQVRALDKTKYETTGRWIR